MPDAAADDPRDASPAASVRLADYRPPSWTCTDITLQFVLDADATVVDARLLLEQDPAQPSAPLQLDGEDLELLSLAVDGQRLVVDGGPAPAGQSPEPCPSVQRSAGGLRITGIAGRCELATRVRIAPRLNTRLEGLYCSGSSLLTQCEAEGFRRITYFPDRPDVLARYTVTLDADRSLYPVLLANGNCVATGASDSTGRHWARFVDPFPKPSYLFAVVAGQLQSLSAHYRTGEGRDVAVHVWAAPADLPRCRHALECVLRAMDWDARRFGRHYDLDAFHVVAAQDFTMGAMENKGLNIFNARYILADPESATDADFEAVESVIGHEYFHNWSGNRVTVRDWFQLSLKEGLTVFRDQEFTADLGARGLKRIEDVRLLRSRQFVEDAGPLSHPVRPAEYREINNFYTATVYEKGAEIVRMLHTLLGEAAFRAGLDRYFADNDGRAATVEDFLAAMEAASGRDLTQFARWYAQAGTPCLEVEARHDAAARRLTLRIRQRLDGAAATLHVPLALTVYDGDGREHALPAHGDAAARPGLVELTAAEHTLVYEPVDAPLPAFLHGLSAPVRLDYPYRAAQLARLVALERDPFNRWDAVQHLALRALLDAPADAGPARVALLDALGSLLGDGGIASEDPALLAECLALPDFDTLADRASGTLDVEQLWRAREDLLEDIAENHADLLERRYREMAARRPEALDAPAIAARRLKNAALALLTRLDPHAQLAAAQFASASTMTDRLSALRCLLHFDAPAAPAALERFATRWHDDALVTDKWLALATTVPRPDAVERVEALLAGPQWQPTNPNRVRAVLGSFARGNPLALHRRDGGGYALLCREVGRLDAINPQVAARLLTALESWHRLDPGRRQQVEVALGSLAAASCSRDVADVLARLLQPQAE